MADDWTPTTILFEIRPCATNSLAVEVETDQGPGFLKCLSDQVDPGDLVCELIGTRLARLFGLSVPDFATIPVPDDPPFSLAKGAQIRPGRGFISRTVNGEPLANSVAGLSALENPGDLARLVVFDTWTVNCDRYRPGTPNRKPWRNDKNLMLSRTGASAGKFVLMPIDHGCCFKCQQSLTPPTLRQATTDDTLYGLFPEFLGLVQRVQTLQVADELQSIQREEIEEALADVPAEWDFPTATRDALLGMLTQRQRRIRGIVEARLTPTNLVDSEDSQEGTP